MGNAELHLGKSDFSDCFGRFGEGIELFTFVLRNLCIKCLGIAWRRRTKEPDHIVQSLMD
jgi:hypothetical protein